MTSQPIAAAAIVLVHSSDLHIDDERDAGKYHGLLGLRAVLDAARAADADFLLLAGDTFDNHRVSTATLQRAADLLATAGRPVILLPGNHDPLLPDCLFQRAGLFEIPGIHVFGLTEQDAISFTERHRNHRPPASRLRRHVAIPSAAATHPALAGRDGARSLRAA